MDNNKKSKLLKSILTKDDYKFKELMHTVKIYELEEKTLAFFWKLAIILLWYVAFLDLELFVYAFILIVYLVFVKVSIKIEKTKFEKKQYNKLESMCEIPKNKWGK